jgi:tight adherence protein B
MSFIYKDWIFIPLIGVCVFLFVYFRLDKWIFWFVKKHESQTDEISRLLDAMFADIDKKRITLFTYLLSFGMGTVFFFLLWPQILMGAIFGLVIGIGLWQAPLFVVRYVHQSRCGRFVEQMVDGLTIMANGVKSGLSVTQSMERVVENLGNPISQEFSLVLSQIRIGRSVEEALVELSQRIPRPDVLMFVTGVNILKETGGNLGETFATIVTTIRERQKVEKKIDAMTTQGMMQGLIITLVPFLIMIILLMLDPKFVKPMFNSALGLFFLFVMLCLQIIGGFMIKKIVTIKV